MADRYLLALVALLALTSAPMAAHGGTRPSVNINWDENTKFKKYHTYTWVTRPLHANVKPADADRVQGAIDRYLASRGFKRSDAADFAIAFNAVGAKPKTYEGSVAEGYATASLSVDIYDAATKLPIWSGIETADVISKLTDQELDKAVELLLTRFPPWHGCSHNPAEELINDCPQPEY